LYARIGTWRGTADDLERWAKAASEQQQDGLVNVNVGDVTIRDAVDIVVAAQVAAEICGLKVGPVADLARQTDRSGEMRTVCETD
jgi:hypothetical protein